MGALRTFCNLKTVGRKLAEAALWGLLAVRTPGLYSSGSRKSIPLEQCPRIAVNSA